MNSIFIVLAIIVLCVQLSCCLYRINFFGSMMLSGKLINKFGINYSKIVPYLYKIRLINVLIVLALLIASFLF